MSRVKFGEVVNRIDGNEDRLTTSRLYYVGGEHYDSESLEIVRYGLIKEKDLGYQFHYPFEPGDVLFMTKNPHLKKAGRVNFQGICSIASFVLRSIDSNRLLQEYLPIIMQSDDLWNYLEANKSGSVNYFITWKTLAKYEFDLPNISEQKKISNIVWAMNEVKQSYINLSDCLTQLVKSRFEEIFINSKECPLTECVWFQEGPGVRSADFRSEGVRLLTGSNINNNDITFGYKSDRFISPELGYGKYKHFLCDVDDILVVISAIDPQRFDEKVVTVSTNDELCLNTGIIRFKPNKDLFTTAYFKEFLKSNYFKKQVTVNMHGIAQMHFGPSHLKKMTVLIPESFEIQNEFTDFVDETEKYKKEIVKSIENISNLMASYINQKIIEGGAE